MKKEQTLANYFGDSDGPKGIRIVKSKLNNKYAFLACNKFPFYHADHHYVLVLVKLPNATCRWTTGRIFVPRPKGVDVVDVCQTLTVQGDAEVCYSGNNFECR